jgi:hypothetical protein
MNNTFDLIDEVNELVENYLKDKELVSACKLGLDRRCGQVYVAPDAVIVGKEDDRYLQYYGGFEYVKPEYRYEIGNYVFYSDGDRRVQGALEELEEADQV